MDFFKELQLTVVNTVSSMKPTDYCLGKVLSVDPLVLDLGDNKRIRESGGNIVFTEAVIEKKINMRHLHTINGLSHTHDAVRLDHSHRMNSSTTDSALSGSYTTTDGLDGDHNTLNSLNAFITITEGIKEGDVILILKVSAGQKFIVLSKLREGKSVTIDTSNNWNWS